MNLAVDTADLATMSKSPWAVSLVLAGILAAVMWVIIERVVTREDEILAQGAALKTEFAESRVEIAAGLTNLQQTIAATDAAMSQRAERWISTLDRLSRIAVAQCYAQANGNADARKQCELADIGPAAREERR